MTDKDKERQELRVQLKDITAESLRAEEFYINEKKRLRRSLSKLSEGRMAHLRSTKESTNKEILGEIIVLLNKLSI